MQTFLVSATSHYNTFEYLDNKRLGKQRVEAFQIFRALHYPNYGWQNHPAVHMWRDSEQHLWNYLMLACTVWRDRGFKDTIEDIACGEFPQYHYKPNWGPPEWVTSRVVSTHKGNLWAKKPTHYPMDWEVDYLDLRFNVCCANCNYYWPSHVWRRGF